MTAALAAGAEAELAAVIGALAPLAAVPSRWPLAFTTHPRWGRIAT
jgi:hypothetical protein